MLMIRFQRIGRKNDPAFRIAVLEKTSGPRAGSYVDLVGTYNPKTKAVTLKPEAIKSWMGKGAQVSPSLHNLLVKEGVVEGTKTAAVVKKSNLEKNVAKKAAEEAAAKVTAAAAPVETPAAAAESEVTVDAPADVAAEAEAAEAPAEEENAAPEGEPETEAPVAE